MNNLTSPRNEEAIKFSGCSLTISESEDTTCKTNNYFFVSVHMILSLTSLTGNILILIVLQKVPSLHSSSKLLFRCLSCTDLIVGLFSQPILVCELTESLAFMSGSILCGESISTLTAISVDRLLALLLKLTYRETVAFIRVRLFVITSWLINIAFAMTYLWSKRFFFMGSCVRLLLLLSISSYYYFGENLRFSSPSTISSTL